jgi:hypothetical protein
MPKYILVELSGKGTYTHRPVVSRELFTQSVHRGVGGRWYCYVPENSPLDVKLRAETRLRLTALKDVELELKHWRDIRDNLSQLSLLKENPNE